MKNRIKVEPKENSFDATVTAVGVGETTQDKEAVVSVTVKMGNNLLCRCFLVRSPFLPSDPGGSDDLPATVEVAPGKTATLQAAVSLLPRRRRK